MLSCNFKLFYFALGITEQTEENGYAFMILAVSSSTNIWVQPATFHHFWCHDPWFSKNFLYREASEPHSCSLRRKRIICQSEKRRLCRFQLIFSRFRCVQNNASITQLEMCTLHQLVQCFCWFCDISDFCDDNFKTNIINQQQYEFVSIFNADNSAGDIILLTHEGLTQWFCVY